MYRDRSPNGLHREAMSGQLPELTDIKVIPQWIKWTKIIDNNPRLH